MELRFDGTGGPRGWPEPGCPCASCARAGAAPRRPYEVLLDGRPLAEGAGGLAVDGRLLYVDGPATFAGPEGGQTAAAEPGDGRTPFAASGDGPYDVVLLDLAADPYRLGALRRAGVIGAATRVVPLWLDHRWRSPAELRRRLAQWGVPGVEDGTSVPLAPYGEPDAEGPGMGPRYGGAGRTLVIGGSRSGKSEEAELRLAGAPDVTYVATGPRGDGDPAWRARIAAHRERRPAHWRTEETADLPPLLARPRSGALLIDGIGTWLAATLDDCGVWDAPAVGDGPEHTRVRTRLDALVSAWRAARMPVVAVTDDVGGGLIPDSPGGRYFRDLLGTLNQRLAAESEQVVQVVAGRATELPE